MASDDPRLLPYRPYKRRMASNTPFPTQRGLLAAALLLLLLALPLVAAQDTTSAVTASASSSSSTVTASAASSTITSLATSTATNSTMTSSSSAAKTSSVASTTKSAWEGAPTVNITMLNGNLTLPLLNKTNPVVVVQWAANLTSVAVTLNIAQLGSNTSEIPSVFVDIAKPYDYSMGRTSRDSSSGGTSSGGYNLKSGTTWEVVWDQGFANWTYGLNINTGDTQTDDPVQPSFLIGRGIDSDYSIDNSSIYGGNAIITLNVVQDYESGVIPGLASSSPLLGDSTNDSVLIFSPLLYEDPMIEPTYPNYTLPPATLSRPEWDPIWAAGDYNDTSYFGTSPNLTVAIVPTDKSPIDQGLGNSIAAIALAYDSTIEASALLTETKWLRIGGVEGFRTYFVVDGLQADTNYTFWVYDDETQTITSPAWFVTKSNDFPCPLMLPTDTCPGIGYASPIAPLSASPVTEIPDAFMGNLTNFLNSFQTSIQASGLACGRDYYSFVSSCLDCHTAYRDWLCRIMLPQCAPTNPSNFSDTGASPAPQGPFTVNRTVDEPRNPSLPAYEYDYVELQPCISVCTAVDRACPNYNLGFICPHRHFNANESYAFIGSEDNNPDGTAGTGWPSIDIWGNRWCNGYN